MSRLMTRIYFTSAIGAILLWWFCVYTDRALLLTRINQLPIEVEARIRYWNWKDTSEEQFCRSAHDLAPPRDPIPNIVHFILLGKDGVDVEMIYAHFLAFKAAILRMGANEIRLHTNGLNTQNRWWKQLEKHVTLVKINKSELQAPNGTPFTSLELPHQADLLRLSILARDGGIYLDTDVYTLKSFKDLLTNPRDVLMGHEGGNRYGLCNGVIVARSGSEFISIWQESYKTFDPKGWNQHSVRKPKQLQVQYPKLICPLSPVVFFWPTWAKVHVEYMHHELLSVEEEALLQTDIRAFGGAMYENQLAFHAWGARDILKNLTYESIRNRNNRFGVLLRDIANAPL